MKIEKSTSTRKIVHDICAKNGKNLQKLATIRIYFTPYVYFICTEGFFDSRPFMYNSIFLKKTLVEVCIPHLYASFGTFCVQIGQLFKTQCDFKLSEEFEIDLIFLRKQQFYHFHTSFTDSLCLELLTNLDAKDTKRSVKMSATNFY